MNLDFKKISGYIRRAKIIVSLILVIVLFVIWTGHYAQLGTPNAKHNDTISTKNKTTQIKSKLNKYMKSVTKDGTAEISFYNLTPKANSKAAKAADASVYKAGNLNVESRSHKGHVSASTYKLFIAAYLYQEKRRVILTGPQVAAMVFGGWSSIVRMISQKPS